MTGPSAPPYLRLEHIIKRFAQHAAVDDVSLEVAAGNFVSILGPSGCGKTTLLRVIAGLEEQTAGSVHIEERDVSRMPPAARRCGIVFQSYALFPNMTALKNVMYGVRTPGMPRREREARAREMLQLVGLEASADQYPAQLSGGMQQRVALARALAPNPALLLLDEPLSALDARVRVRLRHEIRSLQQRLGVTTVMVTHDQEEALTMADEIVVMNEGKVMQQAEPRTLYNKPANPFVADFIGAMNFIHGCALADETTLHLGAVRIQVRDALPYEQGATVTLAVRPESISLVPDGHAAANVIPVTVAWGEFRGAVYRVALTLEHERGRAPDHIEADVQPRAYQSLHVEPGQRVFMQVPPDALHVFPSAEPAAASQAA